MEYSLTYLIDSDALKQLCEKFTKLTQAATTVVDLDGTILVATGWQDICTQFHRVNLDTASRCNESDITLAKQLRLGEKYNVYKCKNGLVEVAVPIIINENHVGNLFTGQFFFKPPEKEHFSRQAIEFGFEEDSYLEALSRVPVFTEEQIKLIMDFLCELAQIIGSMALNNLKALEINKKLSKEITKRKQAEEKERALKTYLDKILNNIGDPVFVKDDQHRMTLVNDSFCSTFDRPREEIIGKTLVEDVPQNEQDHFLAIDRQVLTDGQEKICEESLTVKGGKTLTIITKKTRYIDENGDKFLIGVIRDITERKKAEAELQRSSEKIKHFAYSVAHDLKSPAASTHGLAKILTKKFGNNLSIRGKQICEQIQSSSEDITTLVDKINIFISTKETPLNIENISLEKIFLVLQEEFSAQFNLRGIQWFTPDNLPETIAADRLSIIRIVRNIVENSLKYGGDRLSRIEIGSQMTDDLHILTVTDDGKGLEENDSDNIFIWFKRKTVSTKVQGSGMGLAIVKEIAALHGGDVWQEPAEPKGITFFVSLSRHLVLTGKYEQE